MLIIKVHYIICITSFAANFYRKPMKKLFLLSIALFLIGRLSAQVTTQLIITTSVVPATACTTPCNGSATATSVTGGTAPYTYLWNIPLAPQSTQTATGLCPGTYQLGVFDSATPIQNIGTTTVTITCLGTNGIGLDITSKNDLIIFPNPAADELFLQSNFNGNETMELTISNMIGSVLFEGTMDMNATTSKRISISQLPPGVYSVELAGSKDIIRKKFIKQ